MNDEHRSDLRRSWARMSPRWRVTPPVSRDAGCTDYERTTLVQAANKEAPFAWYVSTAGTGAERSDCGALI